MKTFRNNSSWLIFLFLIQGSGNGWGPCLEKMEVPFLMLSDQNTLKGTASPLFFLRMYVLLQPILLGFTTCYTSGPWPRCKCIFHYWVNNLPRNVSTTMTPRELLNTLYCKLAAFLVCRTGAYTCFNQKVGAEEYNYGSRIDHILISGACFHHCNSVEDHSIFHCHVEDCEIMNHFRRRGDSENISK